MSLLRCHSTAFQFGQDGSVLEVHEEKILCPKKIASVLALWCQRRGFVTLGKVSWLSFPAVLFPSGKAEEAQACCTCLCESMCVQHLLPLVCIMVKMFSSSLCLRWLLLTISSVFSQLLALARAAFSSLVGSDTALVFELLSPYLPCWMEQLRL